MIKDSVTFYGQIAKINLFYYVLYVEKNLKIRQWSQINDIDFSIQIMVINTKIILND